MGSQGFEDRLFYSLVSGILPRFTKLNHSEMKKIYLVIFTLLSYAGYSQEKKTETPPAIFMLNVNGKEYNVTEGHELKLEGNFNSPTVSIKMADYRKFDNGVVSFNYKSSATYQYDESPGNKTWMINGNDDVVFVFELDGRVKVDAIMEQVITQFGKKNCKMETASKKIGDKTITGKRLNITLVGQKIVQEYYELGLNDGGTHILAFQNTNKDDGTPSKDGIEEADLVCSSIKFQNH